SRSARLGTGLPAAAERQEYRDLVFRDGGLELRQRLLSRGEGTLRVRDGEGGCPSSRLEPFGFPDGEFCLITSEPGALLALQVVNVGVERHFGIAKRPENDTVKIRQGQPGGRFRTLHACAGGALVRLPLENSSDAPEIRRGRVGVPYCSRGPQRNADGDIRI